MYQDRCARCGHATSGCPTCDIHTPFLGSSIGLEKFCHTFSDQPSCYRQELADRAVLARYRGEPTPFRVPDDLWECMSEVSVSLEAHLASATRAWDALAARMKHGWTPDELNDQVGEFMGALKNAVDALEELRRLRNDGN